MTVGLPDWAITVPPEPGVHKAPAPSLHWEAISEDQIKQLRRQLLESILSVVTQAFTGLFLPGPFGSAFDQLKTWADSLGDIVNNVFDGLFDFVFGETGLDLQNFFGQWLDWWETIIFGNPNSSFTMTFPHKFAAPPNIVSQFFRIIREFTGIDSFDDLFHLDIFDVITHFITALLHPQDLLARLVGGILPDFQAPQIIHDVIAAIVNAFRSIPIIGPGIADLITTILDMVGFSDDAQTTATTTANELALIKAGLTANAVAGGISVVDDFDRVAATNLGSGYTQIYIGSGAGYEGTDGTGYSHWTASGQTVRQVINMLNTPLTTKTQYASFVLKTAITAPLLGAPNARTMFLRSDATGATCILMAIGAGNVNLTAYVGGTGHSLQSASVAVKPGDFWEFLAGFTGNDHRYVVKLNSKTVLDFVDTNAYGVLTNFRGGYGGTANLTGQYPFGYFQASPPDVGAFSIADRTG